MQTCTSSKSYHCRHCQSSGMFVPYGLCNVFHDRLLIKWNDLLKQKDLLFTRCDVQSVCKRFNAHHGHRHAPTFDKVYIMNNLFVKMIQEMRQCNKAGRCNESKGKCYMWRFVYKYTQMYINSDLQWQWRTHTHKHTRFAQIKRWNLSEA